MRGEMLEGGSRGAGGGELLGNLKLVKIAGGESWLLEPGNCKEN